MTNKTVIAGLASVIATAALLWSMPAALHLMLWLGAALVATAYLLTPVVVWLSLGRGIGFGRRRAGPEARSR